MNPYPLEHTCFRVQSYWRVATAGGNWVLTHGSSQAAHQWWDSRALHDAMRGRTSKAWVLCVATTCSYLERADFQRKSSRSVQRAGRPPPASRRVHAGTRHHKHTGGGAPAVLMDPPASAEPRRRRPCFGRQTSPPRRRPPRRRRYINRWPRDSPRNLESWNTLRAILFVGEPAV